MFSAGDGGLLYTGETKHRLDDGFVKLLHRCRNDPKLPVTCYFNSQSYSISCLLHTVFPTRPNASLRNSASSSVWLLLSAVVSGLCIEFNNSTKPFCIRTGHLWSKINHHFLCNLKLMLFFFSDAAWSSWQFPAFYAFHFRFTAPTSSFFFWFCNDSEIIRIYFEVVLPERCRM